MKTLPDNVLETTFADMGISAEYYHLFVYKASQYLETAEIWFMNPTETEDEPWYQEPIQRAKRFLLAYIKCSTNTEYSDQIMIKDYYCDAKAEGKSDVFAEKYALMMVFSGYTQPFCEKFAELYEKALEMGKNKDYAEAYAGYFSHEWQCTLNDPSEDALHQARGQANIEGWEYARNNNLDEEFIEVYRKSYLTDWHNGVVSEKTLRDALEMYELRKKHLMGIPKNLSFYESESEEYAQQTKDNARWSDITLALALDFDTDGERIIREAAGDKYISIQLSHNKDDYHSLAYINLIAEEIRHKVINHPAWNKISDKSEPSIRLYIAGNSLRHFWWDYRIYQTSLDFFAFCVMLIVTRNHAPIAEIRSGGQSGIEEAATKAAMHFYNTSILAPKGWLFRFCGLKEVCDEAAFKSRFEGHNIKKLI